MVEGTNTEAEICEMDFYCHFVPAPY